MQSIRKTGPVAQILSSILLAACLAFPGSAAGAAFDWGFGAVPLVINHYRGSDQFKPHIIPSPYISYRGDTIEAEQSWVRGKLYANDWFALKISMIVGLAVESEDNDARRGMDDLGYMFEAGPMLIVNLWRSADRRHLLTFEAPVRQVFATDFRDIDRVGIFSVPYLNLTSAPGRWNFGWTTEFSAAVMFADRDYHSYFYTVSPAHALPGRPAYQARGGYSGIQLALILNRRVGSIQLIPFIRYDYLRGVAFEDSPLVLTLHYFVFGMGTFYVF
ncbi:MAG: MipA/OmpV family protein [Spirochaetes bacterium]|nr:MipA/OmpV family protein [Spirochaetota bacterium]